VEAKVIPDDGPDAFVYDGDDLGLSYSPDGCGFKVWSPDAVSVSVALYPDAGERDENGYSSERETDALFPMEKDRKTGVWRARIPGKLDGSFYLYRVVFADGTKTIAADPYAKAVSANGLRMAIVDPARTSPPWWKPRRKPPFRAGEWQDAVICELHVRDFSIDENSGMRYKGKYLAFTERGTANRDGVPTGIDHLEKLGVTHVHLLPVFDFSSVDETAADDPDSALPKYNWGYDPTHYNVPEGSYSTNPADPATRIVEFKAMVQALHDSGIRVIMDVVFNHTHETGGWPFDAIAPGRFYRKTADGNYSDGSACGNEIASERPMVRKFITDSCLHWATEYGIDGFRFDLMGLIDTGTMKTVVAALRRLDPTIIVYGEPWQAGGSVLPEAMQTLPGSQKGLGFAVFNDRLRTAIKGGSDDGTRGFATGLAGTEKGVAAGIAGSIGAFAREANESVNYVTAHDNLNLWDKISISLGAPDFAGNPAGGDPYGVLAETGDVLDRPAVKSVLLASGIILTSQGIPFFQAGDEFLRSKFGDRNSYRSGDRVNAIRWENAGRFRAVADYHAGLIRLRREHPAFRQTKDGDIKRTLKITRAENMGVSFVLNGNAGGDSWRTIFVAYNAGRSPQTFALPAGVSPWFQVVDARRAGVETLAEISGETVSIPPVSMAVLHG